MLEVEEGVIICAKLAGWPDQCKSVGSVNFKGCSHDLDLGGGGGGGGAKVKVKLIRNKHFNIYFGVVAY